MDSKIAEILDESIRQELLVSEFYSLFEATFRKDSDFWYRLSQEELDHGAILKAERDQLYAAGLLPEQLVVADPETLRKQNFLLADYLERLKSSPPSIEKALSIGFCLERTITETIFRSCLETATRTRALRLFQLMVGEEYEHIQRILHHACEMDISVEKNTSLEALAQN